MDVVKAKSIHEIIIKAITLDTVSRYLANNQGAIGAIGAGPGRGWWGPGKGGSHKGKSDYQIGVTSHKAGENARDFTPQDMKEFADLMGKTPITNFSAKLGRGAWQGGWEPTFVTQYKGNGEAIKALASFGKKYNQDAVLVQRRTTRDDPDAQPQNRIEFSGRITKQKMEAIEAAIGQVKTGEQTIGGWTWARQGGKNVLMMTNVPQYGGEKSAHMQNVSQLGKLLRRQGLSCTSRTKHVKVTMMTGDTYDQYISGALTANSWR